MQLELALSESPATALMLWEQLAPAARQAVIERLAQAIARAALPQELQEESGDE
jgi:hypothetical protein